MVTLGTVSSPFFKDGLCWWRHQRWSGVIDDSRPTAEYQACERKQTKIFSRLNTFESVRKKNNKRKNITEELERSAGVNRLAKSTRKAPSQRDHRCFIAYIYIYIHTRVSLYAYTDVSAPITIVPDAAVFLTIHKRKNFSTRFLILTCRALFPLLLKLHTVKKLFFTKLTKRARNRKENRNNDEKKMGGAVECCVYFYRGLSSFPVSATAVAFRFRWSSRVVFCDWISGAGRPG